MSSAAAEATSPSAAIAAFCGAIVTDRLVLRPGTADDAESLFAHFNDFDVIRWLARPDWPVLLPRLRDFIAQAEEARAGGRMIHLAIIADDAPIGAISWDIDRRGSHMGYWLGRAHWGKGYMSEAAAALCDFIFAASNETAIHSGVFEGNSASLAIQKKLGFVETGRSVHYCAPRRQDLAHIDTKLTRTMRRVARTRDRS
jgi:RimJ/RimL family protein N-acetyltransferase